MKNECCLTFQNNQNINIQTFHNFKNSKPLIIQDVQ